MDWLENMIYDWISHFVIEVYQPLDSTLTKWLYVSGKDAHFEELVAEGGFCEVVFNSLTIFAGVLLLIYLFTSLTDKIMKELASTQVAIKALMELLVASIILLHGYSLISGFACIGDNIMDFINNGTQDSIGVQKDIMAKAANEYKVVILCKAEKDDDGNITGYSFSAPYAKTLRKTVKKVGKTQEYIDESEHHEGKELLPITFAENSEKWKNVIEGGSYLGCLWQLIIFNVVSMFVKIAAIAAAVGRLIQLAIYICLSPIAIVNVFGEGMHSQGIRYFKKVFACSLQGPAMALVIYLSSTLSLVDISATTYMAVQVATLMALFKASTFANDVVL